MIRLQNRLAGITHRITRALGLDYSDISVGVMQLFGAYYLTSRRSFDGDGYLSLVGKQIQKPDENPLEAMANAVSAFGIESEIEHRHTTNAFFYLSSEKKNIAKTARIHIYDIVPRNEGIVIARDGLLGIENYSVDLRAEKLGPISHAILKYHKDHNGHFDVPELEFEARVVGEKRRYVPLGILGASIINNL